MSQSRVLVLGANGRLGQALVRQFHARGWSVVAQMRRAPAQVFAPSVQTWVTEGLAGASAMPVPAVDVVVHAVNPPYTDADWQKQAMPQLESALALARQCGALLMFPGNVYGYARPLPKLLKEDTPQQPATVKGRVRLALEQRLQDEARRTGLRSVVLRAGDFFGSGTGSWFDQVIAKGLHKGRLTYPFSPDVATPWAYLPDLADAFVSVADQRQQLAPFSALHFPGHCISGMDWKSVLDPIAQAQGWVPAGTGLKLAGLPWSLIRAGAWLSPMLSSMVTIRGQYDTPHALDGTGLAALIGLPPCTPLDVAARQSLAALGLLHPGREPAQSPVSLA